MITDTCPDCGVELEWDDSSAIWFCPDCGYEDSWDDEYEDEEEQCQDSFDTRGLSYGAGS